MYVINVKHVHTCECVQYCTYMYVVHGTCIETLGLSMELNDDILVQTTSLQTIARIKRVKFHARPGLASFAPICMVCTFYRILLTPPPKNSHEAYVHSHWPS